VISAWTSEVDDETVLATYPETRLDHLNKFFYAGLMRRELILGRCAACNTWQTPLRPLCASCWSTDVVPTPISGRGTIFLLTLLHQGPAAAGVDYSKGWPLAAIELEEQPGLRLPGTIVDCPPEMLRVGLPVAVTWIERDGSPWYAFRPCAPGDVT
jgi:uncharacterized OB-fold protein